MQQESSFEIIINGYAEEPVTIHVNPNPDAIIGILKGSIHPLSERTSVSGIFIDEDVYLWNGEVCKVDEFLREWRGNDEYSFDQTFWMEIENDEEIEVSLKKSMRGTKIFRDLAAAATVCFI